MANSCCCVCLRTNKLLQELNYELAAHFVNLCDYKSGVYELQCCLSCKESITFSLNFKNKCRKASTILTKWKSNNKEKRPIETLHKLLDVWTDSNDYKKPRIFINNNISKFQNIDIKHEINEEIEENDCEFIPNYVKSKPKNQEVDIYKLIFSKIQSYSNDNQNIEISNIETQSVTSDTDSNSNDNDVELVNAQGNVNIKEIESDMEYEVLDEEYLESVENQNISQESMNNGENESELDENETEYEDKNINQSKSTRTQLDTLDDDEPIPVLKKGPVYSKYEAVFNIHNFKTKREIREEFDRRSVTEPYLSAQYRCEICFTVYRSKKRLTYHMKWHNATTRPYSCNICKMRFPTETMLRKHDGRAHRSKFVCKICPFFTYYSSIMLKHFKSHPQQEDEWETVVCEPCNLTFANKPVYNLHVLRAEIHSEIAASLIACSSCGKEFDSQEEVTIHKKIHGGTKKHRVSQPKSIIEPIVTEDMGVTEIEHFKEGSRWFARNGHYYVAIRTRDATTSLKCHSDKCPVRFLIKNGRPKPVIGEHDHEPHPWIPNRNAMFQALKKRATTEHKSLYRIYMEEASRYPDAAPYLLYESVSSSMRKWRRHPQSDPGSPVLSAALSHAEPNESQEIININVKDLESDTVYEVLHEEYLEPIENQNMSQESINNEENESEIDNTYEIKYDNKSIVITKSMRNQQATSDDDEPIRVLRNGPDYSKYEAVFNIHNFKTRREIREEFDRRSVTEPYVSAQYRCDICYTVYRSEKLLLYHMKWHDATTRPYNCNICQMRFPTDTMLRKHDGRAHRSKFICKICPFFTYYSSIMTKHFKSHPAHVDEWETVVCETCNLTFANKPVYNLHVLRTEIHSDIAATLIACSICGKEFKSQEEVTLHKQLPHGGPKNLRVVQSKPQNEPITCKVCKASGPSYKWLYHHHYSLHPGIRYTPNIDRKRSHLCDQCGQAFSNNTILSEHKRLHTGDRPYQCEHCDKSFRTKVTLRGHMIWHFPPTFQCHICYKMYYTQHKLIVHLRVHDDNRCVKCSICGAGFYSSEARREHMLGVHLHIRRKKSKARIKSEIIEGEREKERINLFGSKAKIEEKIENTIKLKHKIKVPTIKKEKYN